MLVIGRLLCCRLGGCDSKHRAQCASEWYVADGEFGTAARLRGESRLTIRCLRNGL